MRRGLGACSNDRRNRQGVSVNDAVDNDGKPLCDGLMETNAAAPAAASVSSAS